MRDSLMLLRAAGRVRGWLPGIGAALRVAEGKSGEPVATVDADGSLADARRGHDEVTKFGERAKDALRVALRNAVADISSPTSIWNRFVVAFNTLDTD